MEETVLVYPPRKDYKVLAADSGAEIRMWSRGLTVEYAAKQQLRALAQMPFISGHLAVMPDAHRGDQFPIGCVTPTQGAVIPALVGMDIGCGVLAVRTALQATDLAGDLPELRVGIEKAVPAVRNTDIGPSDHRRQPPGTLAVWGGLQQRFTALCDKYPLIRRPRPEVQLGTLGHGNHFVEVCADEAEAVWVVAHSGSRGIGNSISHFFSHLAQEMMDDRLHLLPDVNLAYFTEGSPVFSDFLGAVAWAQDYAHGNRVLIVQQVLRVLSDWTGRQNVPGIEAISSVHNDVRYETHGGQRVLVTRNGAASARLGEPGIVCGSMATGSYIVRGLGNADSYCSSSHGCGRTMTRLSAVQQFSLDDLIAATAQVECWRDPPMVTEIPQAYKDLDAVMTAQASLVETVHRLRQLVCVKGAV